MVSKVADKEKAKQLAKLTSLKNLESSPAEQVAYSIQLLETERGRAVVEAALPILEDTYEAAARPVLLELYKYYDTGGPKRDTAGFIRAAILKALRQVARAEDTPLLEHAATTVEFDPFNREEIAQGLRSAALVTLLEADAALASYHCVRILVDKNTSRMSGEPATTAVRVLAAQRQFLPLYQYLMQVEVSIPEVLAECLRNLTNLPDSLLLSLVAKYRTTDNDVILTGLFDLMLEHPAREIFGDFFRDFLATTRRYDVYRYLALAIIGSNYKILIDILLQVAQDEKDRSKQTILVEVLQLATKKDPRVEKLISKFQAVLLSQKR